MTSILQVLLFLQKLNLQKVFEENWKKNIFVIRRKKAFFLDFYSQAVLRILMTPLQRFQEKHCFVIKFEYSSLLLSQLVYIMIIYQNYLMENFSHNIGTEGGEKKQTYIPLTNRVQGPYRKLRTKFFPPRFMAQARGTRAINQRGKTRIRNLQYGPRKRGQQDIYYISSVCLRGSGTILIHAERL